MILWFLRLVVRMQLFCAGLTDAVRHLVADMCRRLGQRWEYAECLERRRATRRKMGAKRFAEVYGDFYDWQMRVIQAREVR